MRYAEMYDMLDHGHGRGHIISVMRNAATLAHEHAPHLVREAKVAALLHDVGLVFGREKHEENGAWLIANDPFLKRYLGPRLNSIVSAVRTHRASTTTEPESILGKILSDADRGAPSASDALTRSICYQIAHSATSSMAAAVSMAVAHLQDKYAPGGYGRRCYFNITDRRLSDVYDPINAVNDEREAWELLDHSDRTLIVRIWKEK